TGNVHASEWLVRPLEALGLTAPHDLDLILPTEAETAEARKLLDRLPDGFVAVHPGSGSPRKNWPPERFASLLDVMAAERPWLLGLAAYAPGRAGWRPCRWMRSRAQRARGSR